MLSIEINNISIQCSLMYLLISTHEFTMLSMLDISAMQLFVSCKLAEKLPVTVQDMTPLNIIFIIAKTLFTT